LPNPTLVADSVGKRFGDRRVLTAASLRVTAGECRALIGRNGAGKSTLLKIAAGGMAPDHGVIIWKGERLQRAHLARFAREGLLLLAPDGLLAPGQRLGAQLEMVAQTFGGGDPIEAMRALRLDQLASQRVDQLSGGERRRANLALALVRSPDCLLADEVFRDVAPLDCELVGETLRALAARGCAVLVTGHEIGFLLTYCDHVTWCSAGTTRELGPPAQAKQVDAFRAEYLGQNWHDTPR